MGHQRAPAGPPVWVVCREMIPAGSVFAFLAEHRRVLFPPEAFADMYAPVNGRPSVPPDLLATVVVLQALHGLSDEEAAGALRFDLRWKAACGLGLYDRGFDPSLLTYFRRRLAHSSDPDRIFGIVRTVVKQTGVLTGRTRRALDSAVLLDAVATQDTITQLIAAIRRVACQVPGASALVAAHCHAHDYAEPGKPKIAWDDEEAKNALVSGLVTDALTLLDRLSGQDLDEHAEYAVGLLALIAGQDVEPADTSDGSDGRWRIARRTAPDRIISTVDPEARHIHKSGQQREDGYKAHLAVEPETGLFTAVALRIGAGAANHEATVAPALLAHEQGGALQILADAAYAASGLRAALTTAGHRLLIKPPALKPAVPGGFTLDDFIIDTSIGTVTCPAGHTAPLAAQGGRYRQRRATFTGLCAACPLRDRCTTTAATGRVVTIRPHHDLQAAARHQAATDPAWQDDYRRWRPMVERAVAWLVARGNRRLRYRGTHANDRWLHHRAAALNLRRLINLGLTHINGIWALVPITA
ncbi:IS1182 family transposase [Spongiactinospora rosea]|uniref:IS1182 family transposase n=1 Tax=Spongiactinospora rosea TaxID=2248750 RepID=A0A366LLE7_9ACTN|nr:IS1182 family transposase [Spongiactinospora rosea]RBQ14490.1 IS1182 family transposase [Spongiactinospora rosea]